MSQDEGLANAERAILKLFNDIKTVRIRNYMLKIPGDDSGKFTTEFDILTDKGWVTVIYPGEGPWL